MATHDPRAPIPPEGDRPAARSGDVGGAPLAGDVLDQLFVGALDDGHAAVVLQYVTRTPLRQALFARLQTWVRRDDVMARLPSAADSAAALQARIMAVPVDDVRRPAQATSRGALFAGARAPSRDAMVGARGVRRWALAVGAAAAVAGTALLVIGRPPVAMGERVYATTTGQRATLTLDDGTRVTLAPRTTLRVARAGARARALALEGEAYFDVASAAGAPFVVRAGGVNARVLGTAFLVSHYPADARVRVAVTTGKVAVTAGTPRGPDVTLTAGRLAEVTDSGTTTGPVGDGERYTGWLSGRLVFHKTPAAEVLATLSRWYGYEFRLADPTLARRRLTAGVSTQSSTDAFATLKLLLDVDLTFDGDVVTLTPRHARPAAPLDRRDARDALTPDTQHEAGR